jgi:hypothetical protein
MAGDRVTSAPRGSWPDAPKGNQDALPCAPPEAAADYYKNLDINSARDKANARVAGVAQYKTGGEPGQGKRR